MQTKLRLVMAASALLYFGPLLAGLTGMGWNAVPVFIALFALWLVVMRPKDWPRQFSSWSGETLVSAFAQVAVNALIVIALFAAGRGIGAVAGFVPNIPPYIPVGLSFLATPLARLVWDPVKGEAVDQLLDDALRQINDPAFRPLTVGPGDVMVDTLLDLPDDADPLLTAEALDSALRGREGTIRLSLIEDALEYTEPERLGLRHGLILWATDPARHPNEEVRGGPATAFSLAGLRPELLMTFATRGLDLLRKTPAMTAAFPESRDVEMTIDASQPAALQSALAALANQIRSAEERSLRG
ncbi:hypothetical protein ACSBLW_09880 [Thioclava sp. FR2]|uniref:hypothetical protein n=1 Tax=Thioclava sp. FR2 TaxID=3445780 RepID=UPI003EBBB643